MSIGYSQFEIQLRKVDRLLVNANKDKKPAWWLYKNDLRTPMFMLEALSRIYSNIIPSKKIKNLHERFKQVEDSLGGLDYYAAFDQEFSENKKVPLKVGLYLHDKTEQSLQALQTLLQEGNWLNGKRIKKIRKRLTRIEWIEKESEEVNQLKQSYLQEVAEVKEFAKKTRFTFKNVEADIHEMRRRLRWLSIYAQALGGVMQLTEFKPMKAHLNKYITPEVVKSPYNQLPVSPLIKEHIILEKNTFLSISWVISTLGKMKDQGLRVHILEEAYKENSLKPPARLANEIQGILGKTYPTTGQLLKEASAICKIYFKEKNLDALVL